MEEPVTTIGDRLRRTPKPAALAAAGDRGRWSNLGDDPRAQQIAREQQMLNAVVNQLGLPNPYFLPHEGVNGSVMHAAGREFLNFSSYDYLGLTDDPRVVGAAQAACADYGTSVSASRLIAGE